MNRKGITLFELVGALVIFSLVMTLTAMIINFYIQANQRITINSQANYEGNLVVRTLDDYFRDLDPTTYSTCPGFGCYVFDQEFSYELNTSSGEVELVIYGTPLSGRIQINNGGLYVDNVLYEFDNFTLNSGSYINVTQTSGINNVNIKIILEATNGTLYEFLCSYSFEELVIPSA